MDVICPPTSSLYNKKSLESDYSQGFYILIPAREHLAKLVIWPIILILQC